MPNNRPLTSSPIHLSYRLFGSLPSSLVHKLETELEDDMIDLHARRSLPSRHPTFLPQHDFIEQRRIIQIKSYLKADRYLDMRKDGPCFLKGAAAKRVIIESWQNIAEQYGLILYIVCVMSNHVHVVVAADDGEAQIDLKLLMTRHKHFTAVKLNQLQNCKGRKVWSKNKYDTEIRPGQFASTVWYVLKNPLKAGLCSRENVLDWVGTWWNPILEQEYIRPYRMTA